MNIIAFSPLGPTVTITAATSAPTPVQVSTTGSNARNQYRVVNAGTVTAHLKYGSTATAAASSNTIPLVPGAVEIFSFSEDWYFTASTDNGTSTLYITPGEGI